MYIDIYIYLCMTRYAFGTKKHMHIGKYISVPWMGYFSARFSLASGRHLLVQPK